jgi:trans-2,3-dihydro-3-hydroxyanthranilate isomerase
MPDMLRYEIVDVFTDRAFAGNPLAVVLDADELASDQLQALAREFNLSETAFPVAPAPADVEAGADYRLRIFTPATELPFAGHPSVGAAWVMARLGRVGTGTVRQACGAGVVPLSVEPGPGRVELTGGAPYLSAPVAPDALLAAAGLAPADLAEPAPGFAGTGLPFAFLSVRPEALARCVPDVAALQALRPPSYQGDVGGLSVLAWDGAAVPARARVRVFAAGVGVPEDPGTGSAALGLGVHLVASGLLDGDGETPYVVVQGVEMGRPSTLACRVEARSGAAVRCRVAGDVVPVARGEIAVPPLGLPPTP